MIAPHTLPEPTALVSDAAPELPIPLQSMSNTSWEPEDFNLSSDTSTHQGLPSFFEQIMVPFDYDVNSQSFEPPPDIFSFLPEQDDWPSNLDIFGPDFVPAVSRALETVVSSSPASESAQQLISGSVEQLPTPSNERVNGQRPRIVVRSPE